MIGWKSIRLGKTDLGIQSIRRGLNIAIEIQDYYSVGSAYRNLADIHLDIASSNHNMRYSSSPVIISVDVQQTEFSECEKYLHMAEDCLSSIAGSYFKNELKGNIYYTSSKYNFEIGLYDKALECADISKESYSSIDNSDRQIKLFNLRGEILLRMPGKS